MWGAGDRPIPSLVVAKAYANSDPPSIGRRFGALMIDWVLCLLVAMLFSDPLRDGWAPVLVTDVADFAFFSRLNWLVEYVPSLSAPADGYFEHKLRYLAWRYRDVPALSVTAEIKGDMLLEDLLVD